MGRNRKVDMDPIKRARIDKMLEQRKRIGNITMREFFQKFLTETFSNCGYCGLSSTSIVHILLNFDGLLLHNILSSGIRETCNEKTGELINDGII